MSTLSAPSDPTAIVQTAGTLPQRPQGAVAPTVAVKEVKSTENVETDIARFVAPTREALDVAAKQIESFVKSTNRNLNFSVDESLNVPVVRVIDPETQSVVRQIPAEETLKIAKSLEFLNSVLVRQKA